MAPPLACTGAVYFAALLMFFPSLISEAEAGELDNGASAQFQRSRLAGVTLTQDKAKAQRSAAAKLQAPSPTSSQTQYTTVAPNSTAPLPGGLYRGPYSSRGIINNGGPIMSSHVNIYITWIGTFSDKQKYLVRNFFNSLSPAGQSVGWWWSLSTMYYGGDLQGGKPSRGVVSPTASFKAEISGTPQMFGVRNGYLLSVQDVVTKSIAVAKWPADPSAVYVVFTDSTITQQGVPGDPRATSCVDYCGWHGNYTMGVKDIKFLWAGVPGCQGCGSDLLKSNGGQFYPPSADAGIHQAISILAHELTETVTDPLLTTWYDNQGMENADKCAYMYGKVAHGTLANGARTIFNMVGANRQQYLIQQNWDPVRGGCALSPSAALSDPTSMPLEGIQG